MKRIEVYLDNNGIISISEFKNYEVEYERLKISGLKAQDFLRNLYNLRLLGVYNNKRTKELSLEYRNCIVNINDCDNLLNKRVMQPLLRNIHNFYSSKEIEQIKNRKVVRKNKHVSKRIIASSLIITILGACAYNALLKENKAKAHENIGLKNAIVSEIGNISSDINISPNSEVVYEENIINTPSDALDTEKNKNEIINFKEKELDTVSIDYENRSETQKAYTTKERYSGLLTKYANMYGIDPILATAVATQESGIHSSTTSQGGATGLMQIQNSVWIGQEVSAYNFETQSKESFTVTLDKIQDLEYNIKIGCMILQNTFQYMKYNTIAAIQCYNMGFGNMMYILENYANESNKSIDQILENPEDLGWLKYRNYVEAGDQKYVEHVLSWIGDKVNLKNVKTDGSLVDIKLDNATDQKRMY